MFLYTGTLKWGGLFTPISVCLLSAVLPCDMTHVTYQHEFIVTILDVQIYMNDVQCYFRSMAVCHHHVTFFDLIIFLLSVYRKCRI